MEKLQISIVLEIMGRPANHLKEALTTLVDRLGSEKGVRIISREHHEPLPMKDTKDLFTSFAEISLEADSIIDYIGILFAYLPSHIEITHPEKIPLSNIDLNDIGNKLAQRLHDYDAITKKALYEKDFLTKKLQEVAPHLFPDKSKEEVKSKKAPRKKSKAKTKNKK
jgi:hypothetical protein